MTSCTLQAVVTAASSNYYDELLNLVGSLHSYEPALPALIYDLGMSHEQLAQIRLIANAELLAFPFDRYPPHVRDLKNYAWKACVVKDAVERKGCVLFLDAGMEVRNFLGNLRKNLLKHGAWFVGSQENLGKYTHPGTCRALGLDTTSFAKHRTLASGMMGWCHNSTIWQDLFAPWWRCSLQPSCIVPPGKLITSEKHRSKNCTLGP